MAAKLERKRVEQRADYALLAANAELPARKTPRARLRLRDRGLAGRARRRRAGKRPGSSPECLRLPRFEPGTRCSTQIPAEPSFELVVVQHTLEHLSDPARDAEQARCGHGSGRPDLRLGPQPSTPAASTATSTTSRATSTSPRSRQSSLGALFALAGFELIAHSNDPSWQEPVERPEGLKRLAAIGRAGGCRGGAARRAAELCARGPARPRRTAARSRNGACPSRPRAASYDGFGGSSRRSSLERNRAKARSRSVSMSNDRSAGISYAPHVRLVDQATRRRARRGGRAYTEPFRIQSARQLAGRASSASSARYGREPVHPHRAASASAGGGPASSR